MFGVYDGHGVRFEYPADWEVDEDEGEGRTTVTVQSPSGLAFAMVTLDEDRPAPTEMIDEAVSAMRAEYPTVEVEPAMEEIGGHRATGHDLEFFSLDMINACAIRGFRTPRRTILIFGQWSAEEAGDEEPEELVRALRASFEETDAEGE